MRNSSVMIVGMSAEDITVVGKPVKAAGYYGPSHGLHTISISFADFAGRISIQGALVPVPMSDSDWFPVAFPEMVDLPAVRSTIYGNSTIQDGAVRQVMLSQDQIDDTGSLPYLEFPRRAPFVVETATIAFSFYLQASWLRMIVDRSYFLNPTMDPRMRISYGYVDVALLNHA